MRNHWQQLLQQGELHIGLALEMNSGRRVLHQVTPSWCTPSHLIAMAMLSFLKLNRLALPATQAIAPVFTEALR
jgi:hypothetical protein